MAPFLLLCFVDRSSFEVVQQKSLIASDKGWSLRLQGVAGMASHDS
jgi:hypothetical protein